jgi:hypothetical protein
VIEADLFDTDSSRNSGYQSINRSCKVSIKHYFWNPPLQIDTNDFDMKSMKMMETAARSLLFLVFLDRWNDGDGVYLLFDGDRAPTLLPRFFVVVSHSRHILVSGLCMSFMSR